MNIFIMTLHLHVYVRLNYLYLNFTRKNALLFFLLFRPLQKKVLQRMQVCKYVDKNQLKSKSIMLLFLLETEVLKFEQL